MPTRGAETHFVVVVAGLNQGTRIPAGRGRGRGLGKRGEGSGSCNSLTTTGCREGSVCATNVGASFQCFSCPPPPFFFFLSLFVLLLLPPPTSTIRFRYHSHPILSHYGVNPFVSRCLNRDSAGRSRRPGDYKLAGHGCELQSQSLVYLDWRKGEAGREAGKQE